MENITLEQFEEITGALKKLLALEQALDEFHMFDIKNSSQGFVLMGIESNYYLRLSKPEQMHVFDYLLKQRGVASDKERERFNKLGCEKGDAKRAVSEINVSQIYCAHCGGKLNWSVAPEDDLFEVQVDACLVCEEETKKRISKT